MPILLSQVNANTRIKFWEDIYLYAVNNLPDNVDPRALTAKGRKPLENLTERIAYIAAYGAHHYYKLNTAFEKANLEKLHNQEIEICDWGCGQAVATCILIDFLLNKGIHPVIHQITLVEPSQNALNGGLTFLQKMLNGNNEIVSYVHLICNRMNDVSSSLLRTSEDALKVHLLSNILDVSSVNLSMLHGLLTETYTGVNKFICTGPGNIGREKIDQ